MENKPTRQLSELHEHLSYSDSSTTDDDDALAFLLAQTTPMVELAKDVLKYFGTGPIDPMLDGDRKLRDAAKAIVATAE